MAFFSCLKYDAIYVDGPLCCLGLEMVQQTVFFFKDGESLYSLVMYSNLVWFLTMTEKQTLSRTIIANVQKEIINLGVTMHLSELIKLQFGVKCHTLFHFSKLFSIINHL